MDNTNNKNNNNQPKKRGRKPSNKQLNNNTDMEVNKVEETVLNQTNDTLNDDMDLTVDTNEIKTNINGLGDVVKAVTNVLGIKTCDECEERRKKLNKMFPFTKIVKVELTEEEIEFINSITNKVNMDQRLELGKIYDKLFGTKTRHCNCPGVYKSMLDRLKIQIDYQNIK